MECPNCNYKFEVFYDSKFKLKIIGEFGDFYKLPIQIEKTNRGFSNDRNTILGCPKCKILFMK
jgi:hypothetical protein